MGERIGWFLCSLHEKGREEGIREKRKEKPKGMKEHTEEGRGS